MNCYCQTRGFSRGKIEALLELQTEFMTGPGKMSLLSKPTVAYVYKVLLLCFSELPQSPSFLHNSPFIPIIPHFSYNSFSLPQFFIFSQKSPLSHDFPFSFTIPQFLSHFICSAPKFSTHTYTALVF